MILNYFGLIWVSRVPEDFPHYNLTVKYITIYDFKPIWGLQFSPESFYQIWAFWAVFGHFWVPMVPEYFPHNYLLLKYVNI